MNKNRHESLHKDYQSVLLFRNPITEEILKRYNAAFRHPGVQYLDKTNNWTILVEGTIFSIVFSNIDKASQFISRDSLKLIILATIIAISFSLISKIIISIQKIASSSTLHLTNTLYIKLKLIEDNVSMIKSTISENTTPDGHTQQGAIDHANNIAITTKTLIEQNGIDLSAYGASIRRTERITSATHWALPIIMTLQLIIFAFILWKLAISFLPTT